MWGSRVHAVNLNKRIQPQDLQCLAKGLASQHLCHPLPCGRSRLLFLSCSRTRGTLCCMGTTAAYCQCGLELFRLRLISRLKRHCKFLHRPVSPGWEKMQSTGRRQEVKPFGTAAQAGRAVFTDCSASREELSQSCLYKVWLHLPRSPAQPQPEKYVRHNFLLYWANTDPEN